MILVPNFQGTVHYALWWVQRCPGTKCFIFATLAGNILHLYSWFPIKLKEHWSHVTVSEVSLYNEFLNCLCCSSAVSVSYANELSLEFHFNWIPWPCTLIDMNRLDGQWMSINLCKWFVAMLFGNVYRSSLITFLLIILTIDAIHDSIIVQPTIFRYFESQSVQSHGNWVDETSSWRSV